jgi:outer membrane immunogenic protein
LRNQDNFRSVRIALPRRPRSPAAGLLTFAHGISKGRRIMHRAFVAAATIAAAALGAPLTALAAGGDWSGFYAGTVAGFGMGGSAVNFASGSDWAQEYFDHELVPALLPMSQSGAFGGVTTGSNVQQGAWVYGVEADIAAAAISGSASVRRENFDIAYETKTAARIDALGTLRLRAGTILPGNTLAFVTGGAAFGQTSFASSVTFFDIDGPFCGPSGFCDDDRRSAWKLGWVVGGGLERAFSEHWTAKAEILYYDLGTLTNELYDHRVEYHPLVFDGTTRFNGALVRVGLNYRFR